MKVVYSILHYQAYEMTIECVENLLSINKNNESIILIIDNGSPNGSGKKIKEKYSLNKRVIVLLVKKNIGFAKGNNIGYKYAKEELKAEILVIMNNDVLIKQDNFYKILIKCVTENSQVSIFAPDIINQKGEHQNPIREDKITLAKLLYIIAYNIGLQVLMRIPLVNSLFIKYLNKKHAKEGSKKIKNRTLKKKNIVPHGAMIIYANEYLHNEIYAFNPKTFLYCEEDLLYEYMLYKNYSSLYIDSLVVYHLEDISTNAITENEIKKRLFISKHKIYSCSILLVQRIEGKL